MSIFADGVTWGMIVVAIGVPVILVVLTELHGLLARRGSPVAGPIRMLRNWVVPAGSLFALLAFAIRSPADQVWVRVAATIFGFLVVLLILSSFNVALFAQAKAGSWRERVPTIFIEIVRLVLVVVGLALIFSWVWGADVGGLITALGVTSIVIGLALQNAVGGVISGLLLLFEQPFKIGDHLDTAAVKGRVIEVNWRAVHIDTGSGIAIIPNSTLSSASFTNLSQPAGPYAVTTTVTFSTDDPPHTVMGLLIEVADGLPHRVPGERATAWCLGSASYQVSIPVASPSDSDEALSVYLGWLWYAARRQGLALDGDSTDPLTAPQMLDAALETVGASLYLQDSDKESLRGSAHLERFGSGEVVLPAGTVPNEVSVVVSGRVRLSLALAGDRLDFAVVDSMGLLGHTALTREPTKAVATATEAVTLLVVPLATFDQLVRARPRLATDVGQSLELHRDQAAEALAPLPTALGGAGVGAKD